jgi:hypothetical protein
MKKFGKGDNLSPDMQTTQQQQQQQEQQPTNLRMPSVII